MIATNTIWFGILVGTAPLLLGIGAIVGGPLLG